MVRPKEHLALRTSSGRRPATALVALATAALALAGCTTTAADEPLTATPPTTPSSLSSFVEDGIRVGEGDVEVVVFGDASCPYCAALDRSTADAVQERIDTGEITVVLHPMTYVSAKHGDETEYSARSAALLFAAAAAGESDAVPALYSLVLENQPGDGAAPTDDELLAFARQAGVEADLSAALSGDEFLALAVEANDRWLGAEIPGTGETLQYVPTVAVDGALFEMRGDGTDLDRLDALIDAAHTD